jgi:hypothetical protein
VPETLFVPTIIAPDIIRMYMYRGADKSLAIPERKKATATEDYEFHISYL